MCNTLYQTIKNENSQDYIESHGPFLCTRPNAWLGSGYYFWDTFIEHAHYWGVKGYHNDYMICESKVKFSENDLLDLTDPKTLQYFWRIAEKLKSEYQNTTITISFIIKQLKRFPEEFHFKAIRARVDGVKQIRIPFETNYHTKSKPFLVMNPQIQFCICNLNIIGNNNYKIIFTKSKSNQTT